MEKIFRSVQYIIPLMEQKIFLKKLRYLIWVCLLFLKVQTLICDGDFERYATSSLYMNCYYQLFPSNTSCWYSRDLTNFQVKNYFSPVTTKGAQLVVDWPIYLCQNITLEIGEIYDLSFDLYCPLGLKSMQFTVAVDNITVGTYFISTQNKFSSGTATFTANSISNELCFSETHILVGGNSYEGGIVDNITLIKTSNFSNANTSNTSNASSSTILPENLINETIQKSTIYQSLSFQIQVEEAISQITFISDLAFTDPIQPALTQNIDFIISGEQKTDVEFGNSSEGNLSYVVHITEVQDLEQLEIVIRPIELIESIIIFEPLFEKPLSFFNILSNNSQQILEILSPAIITVTDVINTIYKSARSSFCSYFIFSLFSYGNLTLMYFFLQIKSVPSFVREVYQITIRMLYEQNSLINWLIDNLSLDQGIFQFKLEEEIPEKINKNEDGFEWFGKFSFSSKIILNNLDYFMILGLLIVKIALVRLLYYLMNKKCKISWNFRADLALVFFIELLTVVPFMLISCISLIDVSFSDKFEKLEKMLQFITLLICLLSLPFYLIQKKQSIYEDLKKKKKEEGELLKRLLFLEDEGLKNSSKRHRKEHLMKMKKEYQGKLNTNNQKWIQTQIVELKCQFGEMLLYLTIPVFIYVQYSSTFFALHFFILFSRIILMVKYFHHLSLRQKFFRPLICIAWLVHHSSFFAMYILDGFSNFDDEFISEVRIICGMLVLWTVIIGMILEILKSILEILMIFYSIWRGLKHYLRKKGLQENYDTKGRNKIKPRSENMEVITGTLKKVKKEKEEQPKKWDVKVEDFEMN